MAFLTAAFKARLTYRSSAIFAAAVAARTAFCPFDD